MDYKAQLNMDNLQNDAFYRSIMNTRKDDESGRSDLPLTNIGKYNSGNLTPCYLSTKDKPLPASRVRGDSSTHARLFDGIMSSAADPCNRASDGVWTSYSSMFTPLREPEHFHCYSDIKQDSEADRGIWC